MFTRNKDQKKPKKTQVKKIVAKDPLKDQWMPKFQCKACALKATVKKIRIENLQGIFENTYEVKCYTCEVDEILDSFEWGEKFNPIVVGEVSPTVRGKGLYTPPGGRTLPGVYGPNKTELYSGGWTNTHGYLGSHVIHCPSIKPAPGTQQDFVVEIDPQAKKDILGFARAGGTTEVSGIGLVHLEKGVPIITEIIFPKQTGSGAYTEIDQQDLARITAEQAKKGKINEMRLHWHSHCNMGVGPSGTDLTDIAEYLQLAPWRVSIIVNNRGDFNVRFDMKEPLKYSIVKCKLETIEANDLDKEHYEAILKKQLKCNIYQRPSMGFGSSIHDKDEDSIEEPLEEELDIEELDINEKEGD